MRKVHRSTTRFVVVKKSPMSRRLATSTGRFTIRAATPAWEEFWKPVPRRDHHDLWSMLAAGILKIDGDLLPLIQNLQYFKDVLAAPRDA